MNTDEKIIAKLFEGQDDPFDETIYTSDWDQHRSKIAHQVEEHYDHWDEWPKLGFPWQAVLGGLITLVLMMGTLYFIIRGLIWLLS